MAAAETSTLSEVELLRHQARTTRQVVRINAAGLSQEESLAQPSPGGNCLNWVVGHLVAIYDEILPLLGQKRVLEESVRKRYTRGSAPIRTAGEAQELGELLAAFDEASRRFDAGLASLTPEVLNRRAPVSPGNDPNETVRSLLSLISFHQAYHSGQLGVLRRVAGKEGAIP